ncbi:MAG: ROK family protein [Mycobacteriales bacterium]
MTAARPPDRLTSGELLHHLDPRSAFEQLRMHESLTRGELADLTSRSRTAAADVVDQLMRLGAVHQVAHTGTAVGGPAAQRYALTPTFCYVVGADVRHDEVTVAVADIGGTLRAQITESFHPTDDAAQLLRRTIEHCLHDAAAPLEQVRRVVMGTPGVIDPVTGEFAFAYLMPSWKHALTTDIRALLGGVPVVFENDVNLAAMAEARDGVGRGIPNLVFAWMSIGVGLGTILNGRLHRGRHGWSGEIGFIPAPMPPGYALVPGLPHPSIHQLTCLAAIASAADHHGFGTDARAALGAAQSAGERGSAFLDDVALRVAQLVSTTCLVVNPGLVVLGGSFIHAGGEDLLGRIQRATGAISPVPVRLAYAEVGDEAILRGALQAALDDTRDGLFAS